MMVWTKNQVNIPEVAIGWEVRAKPLSYVGEIMSFTVGHENWLEQHSKQDSYNYLIQRFYLKLIRYN